MFTQNSIYIFFIIFFKKKHLSWGKDQSTTQLNECLNPRKKHQDNWELPSNKVYPQGYKTCIWNKTINAKKRSSKSLNNRQKEHTWKQMIIGFYVCMYFLNKNLILKHIHSS